MKVAALDLGSNTFLCLIAEVDKSGISKVYSDTAEVVRLGQGLANAKQFHPDALLRADGCLKTFSELIDRHKPDKILAMATSAARDATNQHELFALCQKHNIPLEIIPGESEATITYQGAVSGLDGTYPNLMVLDIGGGSTEFIFGNGKTLIKGASYNIGCVRLTEKFITRQPTPAAEVQQVIEVVDAEIDKAIAMMPPDFKLDQIVAVAGTPTSLAAAELGIFDPEKIDGYQLSRQTLESWLKKFSDSSVKAKIEMGIPAGRADVILVGVIILLRTLTRLNLSVLMVSTRGVRYGVAIEMYHRYFVAD